MADILTKRRRSYNMSQIKSRGTSIEKLMEVGLKRTKLKYCKNYAQLIGKPDFVIVKHKTAIFCDSAFWHGYKNMKTARHEFKTNKKFWISKIRNNIIRDKEVNKMLKRDGWKILRFWDFQIKNNIKDCIFRIIKTVRSN